MTEKSRFKRAFTEGRLGHWLDELVSPQTAFSKAELQSRIKREFERCYALLEEAEQMAEYYVHSTTGGDFDADDGHVAREFLERLSNG